MLLPLSVDELIPRDHACRVVNQVINNINLEPLNAAYDSAGNIQLSSQILLKVLVYGYVSNIYSSRKLEAACKESIYLMFLSRW
ncbi:transposase [Dyadobacter sp. CY107]|uniref:transposase n=1 Tax=Dyadobacter fanqingshengii TaxID=2906443 RepID=UPI001F36DB14|nr:transposase [Dyadobacter fanqingshengii]MCF2502717.1 transposase [Dyadobacter fanqingshengii]